MLYHQYTKTQLVNELKSNLQTGLTDQEARVRLRAHGPNQLPEKEMESWAVIFFRQFKSPLVYILVICGVIIYKIGDWNDAVIILGVIVFNAIIGAIQEGRSAITLKSLQKLTSVEATVLRDGEEKIIPEQEVVVGDILVLMEGQRVAADARVIFANQFSIDESPLTGETGAIHKHDGTIENADTPVANMGNMVFKGTAVLTGHGQAIVVGTGIKTEIGKIHQALALFEEEIPLQKNIKKLANVIIISIIIISGLLFFLGLSTGRSSKEMFGIVVSLAVSMIPEGLPLVLTLVLVTGIWRMSKRKALVKRLQAVEALGQADVLAVDKTGTITKNEMVALRLWMNGENYKITGNGYEPVGHLQIRGQAATLNADIEMAAKVFSLSSRASVTWLEQEGVHRVSGDPTEAAMGVLGEKLGFGKLGLLKTYEEVSEIPFDYKNKYHAVFYRHEKGILGVIAGAPEVVLKESSTLLDHGHHRHVHPQDVKLIESIQEEYSADGLRVVAWGYVEYPHHSAIPVSITQVVFGGLVGIEDALRPEAARSVHMVQEAGIKVVMITGDHKTTAQAIAKQAGIFHEGDTILTGPELENFTPMELRSLLPKVSVFARVTPEDKLHIIQAYKIMGLTIAMTGDGVNDAPSLAAADLGVAMGKIGTEVAKEAADLLLLDDNLSSVAAAVEEGRIIYRNIQKTLFFLFSTSLGELLTIAVAIMIHMPMPVLAVQILWLNLITDPLIGMALALGTKEPGVLDDKPKDMPKYFITKTMVVRMVLVGLIMSAGALIVFKAYSQTDYYKATTIVLTTLAIFQWLNGFNSVSETRSVFSKYVLGNWAMWAAIAGNIILQILAVHTPLMNTILKTTPLTWWEWLVCVGIAFSIIFLEELRKLAATIL